MVLALLAAAQAALADQPALREAAHRRGYSAADIAAIEGPLAQAEGAGIPVEPLVKKAHEGVAKKAPAAVIVRVLNEQKARAQTVRDALPKERRNDGRVLQAALTAAAAGAKVEAIKSVGEPAGARAEAAFYVLGVLCSGGVESSAAGAFVRAQLEAGLLPAEMESLSAAGARAVRAGLASNSDLASITKSDLENGGSRVLAGRLNGVRATVRGGDEGPVREPVAGRQAERNAETQGVRPPAPKNADGSSQPGGDKPGDDDHGDDDHEDKKDDEKHDAPRLRR